MALNSLPLTTIIIAGNSETQIARAIRSLRFCPHIVIVAANSTDDTVSIIRRLRPDAKIHKTDDQYNKHFSKWRNLGFQHTSTPWIFYLDSDEVVTPLLRRELINYITNPDHSTNAVIPRANHFLGVRVRHGGSYPDYVKRLYHRNSFKGYQGILHEEPIVSGDFHHFTHPMLHYTHTDLTSMLDKSIAWTQMEAENLLNNQHPPMLWWRFFRMMITKFWGRFISQSMWRDGTVGLISSIFESFDTFMIYANLWELQHQKNSTK
jgi:glycosyltransferase involved in cell wall biosynthesis